MIVVEDKVCPPAVAHEKKEARFILACLMRVVFDDQQRECLGHAIPAANQF
jgi:hypothetical protein